MRTICIAARKSDLARLQAYEVGKRLIAAAAQRGRELKVQYTFRSSLGDQRADDPLWKMPEKGVFTEDFVEDLKSGAVDIVVHSWKDLPVQQREGTVVAATLPRADARDVLLVRQDAWQERIESFGREKKISSFRVLTSSPRRTYCLNPMFDWLLPWAQISPEAAPPQIEFVPVRGNIATRIEKIQTADALVVAKAALDRLLTADRHADVDPDLASAARKLQTKLAELNFVVLPLSANPTAAAQGALGIEVRSSDTEVLQLCKWIDAVEDREDVEEERRILASYGGGCHQKIGVSRIRRAGGVFTFLKGLTDDGVVLDKSHFSPASSAAPTVETLVNKSVWRGEGLKVDRSMDRDTDETRIRSLRNSQNVRLSIFVARAEAWDANYHRPGDLVWTAGLSTWKKLTRNGVWVHGSSESFGESESARVEDLVGAPIATIRLTHRSAVDSENAFATYRVRYSLESPEALNGFQAFHWRAKGQIEVVEALKPEVFKPRRALHVVGPGRTLEELRRVLRKAGWTPEELETGIVITLEEF